MAKAKPIKDQVPPTVKMQRGDVVFDAPECDVENMLANGWKRI